MTFASISVYIHQRNILVFIKIDCMPKIQDITKQYNTDRETIANAYKAVVGKALTARVATIKDEERALIEPTMKLAGIGKPSADEPKVFKATEVGF